MLTKYNFSFCDRDKYLWAKKLIRKSNELLEWNFKIIDSIKATNQTFDRSKYNFFLLILEIKNQLSLYDKWRLFTKRIPKPELVILGQLKMMKEEDKNYFVLLLWLAPWGWEKLETIFLETDFWHFFILKKYWHLSIWTFWIDRKLLSDGGNKSFFIFEIRVKIIL